MPDELKVGKISVEMGLDNSGLQDKAEESINALESIEDAAEKIKPEIKPEYDKKPVEQAESAFEKLTQTIEEQENELEDLKDQYQKTAVEQGKDADATQELGKKIIELTKELEDNKEQLEGAKFSEEDYKESLDESKKSTEGLNESTEKMSKGFTVAKGILAALISSGIKKGGSAILNMGKDILKTGEVFTATMSEVQAISGANGAELEKLRQAARQFGSETVFSASDSAQALKFMALAGWDADKSIAALPSVLDLAAASGMSLGAAADMVTDYLSAFNMEAEQSTYLADLLTYAQGHSNTSAQQLGEAWKNCAANLNAAGQDVETVTALLEAMANQGYKGSEAGTSVSAIMRDITDKMDKGKIKIGETAIAVQDESGNIRDLTVILSEVQQAVDGMGTAQQSAALSSTFTQEAIKGLNLILNEGMDKVSGYESALRKSTGAASEAAKTMSNNLTGDIKILNSALDDLKLEIYEGAEQPIRKVVQAITRDGVPALKALLDNADKIIPVVIAGASAWAGYTAAIAMQSIINGLKAGFISLTGAKVADTAATEGATAAQHGLNAAMAANPIGLLIGGIAALTAGLISYKSISKSVVESTNEAAEAAKKYTEGLRSAEEQQKKSIADAVGEADKLKILQEEYDALRDKLNLTAHEKKRLDTVAESIAGTLGVEVSEIRNLSGAYIDLNDQIDNYIENLLRKARQEAAENIIKEASASMFTLEDEISAATEATEEARKNLRKAKDDLQAWKDEWHENHNGEMGATESSYIWEREQEIKRLEDQLTKAANKQYDLTNEYDKANQKLNRTVENLRQIGNESGNLSNNTDELGDSLASTGELTEETAKALEDLQKKSASFRSEMSSLAASYEQLNNGQQLSIDTILNLIDKYPEYTGLLIEAANNANLQKSAIETLFEAKKEEYILTQQTAIDNIKASYDETDVFVQNTKAKINALKQLTIAIGLSSLSAQNEKIAIKSGKSYVDPAAKYNEKIAELEKALDNVYSNNPEIARLEKNIAFVQGLSIDSFKGSGSSRSSSGSGASSSTADKSKYTTDASGVHAEGETYIKMYLNWIGRMQSMGKMSTSWEIDLLEKLLRNEETTAEERYELENRLYQAKKKLRSEELAALDKLGDAIVTALRNKYEQQKQLEEQRIDESIEAWKKWENETVEAIQGQIDALDDLKDAHEEENARAEYENKRKTLELEKRYAKDDYTRKQIQKQINLLDKEEKERLFDLQIAEQKKALQEQQEAAKKLSATAQEKLTVNKQEISAKYNELLNDKALQGEAKNILLTNSQAQITQLINSYAGNYEMIGTKLGESVYDGFKSKFGDVTGFANRVAASTDTQAEKTAAAKALSNFVSGSGNRTNTLKSLSTTGSSATGQITGWIKSLSDQINAIAAAASTRKAQISRTANAVADTFYRTQNNYQNTSTVSGGKTVNVYMTVNFNDKVDSPIQVKRQLESVGYEIAKQIG